MNDFRIRSEFQLKGKAYWFTDDEVNYMLSLMYKDVNESTIKDSLINYIPKIRDRKEHNFGDDFKI